MAQPTKKSPADKRSHSTPKQPGTAIPRRKACTDFRDPIKRKPGVGRGLKPTK